MNHPLWNVYVKVFRTRAGEKGYFQDYSIETDPEEYVLDLIERIWVFQDHTLTFRQVCHHSTCGACGMLVNGREKLTCITTVKSVTHNGGTLKIEPLRNFPVISDLVVDMGKFFLRMEQAEFSQVAHLKDACLPFERISQRSGEFERLVDCIECGLCISACPSAATSQDYVGPAVLAALQHDFHYAGKDHLPELGDCKNGLWRCHNAFECSEVCPSKVDPGWRIMDLRRKVFTDKILRVFKPGKRKA